MKNSKHSDKSVEISEEGTEFSPQFHYPYAEELLMPVIVQEEESSTIIMLAYMNKRALELSIKRKEAVFYSRSRKELWHKGQESGNVLHIVSMYIDCDQDALLLRVRIAGKGKGCHTGRKSCFYRMLKDGHLHTITDS